MPGHADGISCMVSFSINPTDPFSSKASDWAQLERDIRDGLRVSGHKIKDVNTRIAKLDDGKRVKYLDIGGKFLQPDGTLTKEIMPDFLHLSKKGYQIWADAITATLEEMLKKS